MIGLIILSASKLTLNEQAQGECLHDDTRHSLYF